MADEVRHYRTESGYRTDEYGNLRRDFPKRDPRMSARQWKKRVKQARREAKERAKACPS